MALAQLDGLITNPAKDNHFFVQSASSKKIFRCRYTGFLPYKRGDSIVALGTFDAKDGPGKEVLHITTEPLVLISDDKALLLDQFIQTLRCNDKTANNIYDHIAKIGGIAPGTKQYETKVASCLDQLATDFIGTGEVPKFDKILPAEDVKRLLAQVSKQRNFRRLWLLGLTNKEIREAHLNLLVLYKQCLNNALTVAALPLNKAISIWHRQGRKPEEDDLLCGKIVRRLYNDVMTRGWSGTPTWALMAREKVNGQRVPEFPRLPEVLEKLQKDYGVVYDEAYTTIYLAHQYDTELKVSAIIKDCLTHKPETKTNKTAEIDYNLTIIIPADKGAPSRVLIAIPSTDQKAAIAGALDNPICIISGGAGSGKTTILNVLVNNFEKQKATYIACSFTGKASSRMTKVTGRQASTIHRVINRLRREARTAGGKQRLVVEYVLIDESSMLTMELFAELHNEIMTTQNICPKYIFIGDANQLAAVSWGSLFPALLRVPEIPKYWLTENHRQYKVNGEKDGIILNAKRVIDYDSKDPMHDGNGIVFEPTDNFHIIDGDETTVKTMIECFNKQGISANEVIIITPYNRPIGNINKIFESIYYPATKHKSEIDSSNRRWTVGDRVMSLSNDYTKNIFNGEEGLISDVTTHMCTINFNAGQYTFKLNSSEDTKGLDGKIVTSSQDEDESELSPSKIIHGNCLTIHKSQGSEWEHVILYIPEPEPDKNGVVKASNMLNRNLLYTAMTRARRSLFIVTKVAILKQAAMKAPPYRCDNLAKRITKLIPKDFKPVQEIVEEEYDDFDGYD